MEFDIEGVRDTQGRLIGPPKESVAARFFFEPYKNEVKSREKGCPIFDDVTFVEIIVPGENEIRRRPATEADKERFAAQYDAFTKGKDQEVVSGTPLAVWPPLSAGQVETLRYFGAKTVEQFAGMNDTSCSKLGPGFVALRQKARDWLAAAKDGATLGKLRDELKERDDKISALERMLADQAHSIEGLRSQLGQPIPATPAFTVERKRGRPKKAETVAE